VFSCFGLVDVGFKIHFHIAGGVGGAGGGAWLPPWPAATARQRGESGGKMPGRNSPRTPVVFLFFIFGIAKLLLTPALI
jgi:hypothetical protein